MQDVATHNDNSKSPGAIPSEVRREIAGILVSCRNGVCFTAANLQTVAACVCAMRINTTGPDSAFASKAGDALEAAQHEIAMLASFVELIAAVVGLEVDPSETEANPDELRFIPPLESGAAAVQ